MRTLTALAVCVLMTGPASAQSKNLSKGQSLGESSGVNALVGVAPSTQDFVTRAGVSNLFEIEAGRIAAEKADEPTRAYARTMIEEHETMNGDLKAAVSEARAEVELPTNLDPSHRRKIETLNKMIPASEFTKQYHADQVTAHATAVDLFKRYGEGGENAGLKAWAERTRPHLERHLRMAEELNRQQAIPTRRSP